MGEDDVLDVANSGTLWFTPMTTAKAHSEGVDGYCLVCVGVVWPCDIWVEDRDAFDAEVVES
jgi:hypothetical protein